MNILHISPYFPDINENHAGGVCMGKEVETLKKWNEVYVLTFVASDFDRKIAKRYKDDNHYKAIYINKWTRLIHIILQPFLPNFFSARSSLRFYFYIINFIKKYKINVVHAEYASMGQYFDIIRWLFPHIKIYFVEHDITVQSYERKMKSSTGIKSIYYKWQYHCIKKVEGTYCRQSDLVITFNEKDKSLIQRFYDVENVIVINPYYGLDDSHINSSNEISSDKASICFVGQMGRQENYEAASRLIRISGRLKNKVPELQVYIIGNSPPKELAEMQSEFIHVTGFVDNVDEYILKCQLAVFPLTLGAGIKIKVLRSLALGVPVITNLIGAEGIDEYGEVIILAEKDEEFEESIENMLNNNDERQRLSIESKTYVKERFGWEKSEMILKNIYK